MMTRCGGSFRRSIRCWALSDQSTGWPLWRILPEQIILDWDSTVLTKYGHQEGAEVGYNPTKPGRRSHHLLLAVVVGARLCPVYRFRSGNTVSASQWLESMSEAQRWLGEQRSG